MDDLAFSQNWNGKLHNNVFTTFRLYSRKYTVGNHLNISLCGKPLGKGQVIRAYPMKLRDLTDDQALLDTGYPKDEMEKIIRNMYKNMSVDVDTALFVLTYIKKVS